MLTIRYIGRPERASPAEGYSKAHEEEQARIVAEVLKPAPVSAKRKTSKV
jgi:2-oxoglutarate dehydrogenase E1 component